MIRKVGIFVGSVAMIGLGLSMSSPKVPPPPELRPDVQPDTAQAQPSGSSDWMPRSVEEMRRLQAAQPAQGAQPSPQPSGGQGG